jgi:hypothetical protein
MLSGPSDSGKTTTIHLVCDVIAKEIGITPIKIPIPKSLRDFKCKFMYLDKSISFFSMGDYSMDLIAAMEFYKSKNCDFFICACNSDKTFPYRQLREYSHAFVVPKTKTENKADETAANEADKDIIIQHLRYAITTNLS